MASPAPHRPTDATGVLAEHGCSRSALFVQVAPEVKRRQIGQVLEEYETVRRETVGGIAEGDGNARAAVEVPRPISSRGQ